MVGPDIVLQHISKPKKAIYHLKDKIGLELNVKRHGQEAAQSGLILVQFELIFLLR